MNNPSVICLTKLFPYDLVQAINALIIRHSQVYLQPFLNFLPLTFKITEGLFLQFYAHLSY